MARAIEHSPRAWARLRVDVNCALRRGAWYRAVRLTRDNVTVDVRRERVPVPRRLVQTIFARPARWSVVPRPSDAVNLPGDWGARYLVCPACQGRAPFSGFPRELPCPHCRGVFTVAWEEHYLKRE
ncbi:MAG: hypothetical protein DMD60_07735 [Gemmatimonadetes bacterium]|nr:MAG: hypothetical protein DMD60_07735 [Gemmatimonadota bacterium]